VIAAELEPHVDAPVDPIPVASCAGVGAGVKKVIWTFGDAPEIEHPTGSFQPPGRELVVTEGI
jgi:hypothetical protein